MSAGCCTVLWFTCCPDAKSTPGYYAAGTLFKVTTQVPTELDTAGMHSAKVHYAMPPQIQYVAKHRELIAQLKHTSDKHTLIFQFRSQGLVKASWDCKINQAGNPTSYAQARRSAVRAPNCFRDKSWKKVARRMLKFIQAKQDTLGQRFLFGWEPFEHAPDNSFQDTSLKL